MTRRGRPKKPGPRHPGGKLKSEDAGRITATAFQRLRDLGRDPILETQLGRLGFMGELEAIEVQAGFRIAEIYGRYDRAMGRRRSAASPSYEVGRSGGPADETESGHARSEAAMRAYGNLQAELKLCPRGVKSALEELCVEDRPCPPGWLPRVKLALNMLVVPLGLRWRRK